MTKSSGHVLTTLPTNDLDIAKEVFKELVGEAVVVTRMGDWCTLRANFNGTDSLSEVITRTLDPAYTISYWAFIFRKFHG